MIFFVCVFICDSSLIERSHRDRGPPRSRRGRRRQHSGRRRVLSRTNPGSSSTNARAGCALRVRRHPARRPSRRLAPFLRSGFGGGRSRDRRRAVRGRYRRASRVGPKPRRDRPRLGTPTRAMSSRARERRSPARSGRARRGAEDPRRARRTGPPPTRRRPSVPALERAFASRPVGRSSASSPASSSSPGDHLASPPRPRVIDAARAGDEPTAAALAHAPRAPERVRTGRDRRVPADLVLRRAGRRGGKKPGGARRSRLDESPGLTSPPTADSRVAHNHGFDDERGDCGVTLRDHLAYRYEILEIVGKGSFGKVLRCFDHKTGSHAAVLVIRNKKRAPPPGARGGEDLGAAQARAAGRRPRRAAPRRARVTATAAGAWRCASTFTSATTSFPVRAPVEQPVRVLQRPTGSAA